MDLIKNLQNSSRERKIRILIFILIATAVALVSLWIFTSRIGKNPSDIPVLKENFESSKKEYLELKAESDSSIKK